MRSRGNFAAVAGAVLGLGLVLALSPRLPWRAAPDQLPGMAAVKGFDPRMGALRLLLFAVMPLIGGAVAWRIARPRPRPLDGPRQVAFGPPRRGSRRGQAILVPAAAAHALTVWVILVAPAASFGIGPLVLYAALLVASLALAAALGGGDAEEGSAYLGSACLLLPLAFLVPGTFLASGMSGLAGYALPVLARSSARIRPALARTMRALTLAVLLPGSVTALAGAACTRPPGVANLFEDGHALLPASEYLRGELPYRDIVPGHGLISDGLLAAGELRLFGDDYFGWRRAETVTGLSFWPAFYALGYAATASPAFAFGGLLLSFLFFPQYAIFRITASLWTLAVALYASRTKSPGAWLACGAALPLGLCTAVEFAAYTGGGVAVALWVARGHRGNHLRRLCLGALLSSGAIALALAAFGILGGFVRTTFGFVPSLLPAYALGFERVALPRDAAGLLAALGDTTFLYYAFVTLSVVLLGGWLPRAPRVGPRARSVLPICAWAVFAMLSVLERQHAGYGFEVVPVGLLLVARWLRGPRDRASPRALAPAAVLGLLVWLRRPVVLVTAIASVIADPRPPADLVALSEPPRARGALFRQDEAALVEATGHMMRRAGFQAGDTWLDFTSMSGLYYLFGRDCPIRYCEVGFYESESAQREVIAAVAGNTRVRAVLTSDVYGTVDGIPNAIRAPRVAEFIRERFRPFYRDGDVEFWLRKE